MGDGVVSNPNSNSNSLSSSSGSGVFPNEPIDR